MKRLFSLFLVAVMALGAIFSLSACKKDDGVPEGMQLVRGGEEYGFNFYAPEEWTVSNRGEIACVYVSKLDSTSITLVEADAPKINEGQERAAAVQAYFEADIEKLPFEVTRGSAWCEKTALGNATEAYKFTYSYKYGDAPVGVMQILAYYGERFYVFTYTSSNTEKTEGKSYYEYYLAKLEEVMKQLIFTAKNATGGEEEYPRDSEGYILVSDKTVAGFELYVPDAYSVDFSSGIVSVTRDDGTNISVSKATYTNVDKDAYWEKRKAELSVVADKTTDSEGNEVSTVEEVEGGISVKVELQGVTWAYSYEYTYSLGGKDYHVYQVLIVKGMNGFVFTYTASEADYAAHLDEAKKILAKIGY